MLSTRFTELVGCRVPVQQAPMGSVSTPDLAVAVADAGGVGTVTALGMSAAQLDAHLGAMAARTSGVLGANFLTDGVDRDAVAAAAERVRLVDFFWLDPDPVLAHTTFGCELCAPGAFVPGTAMEALAAGSPRQSANCVLSVSKS